MKIQVRTVKKDEYSVEVEPTSTVAHVKEVLGSTHNVGAPATQRLIYQGRVLTDALTIAEVRSLTLCVLCPPSIRGGLAPRGCSRLRHAVSRGRWA